MVGYLGGSRDALLCHSNRFAELLTGSVDAFCLEGTTLHPTQYHAIFSAIYSTLHGEAPQG